MSTSDGRSRLDSGDRWEFHRDVPASQDIARLLTIELATELSRHDVEEELSHRLLVVLSELVNNAFLHGYQGRESGDVRVRLDMHGDRIRLRVADDGPGLQRPGEGPSFPTQADPRRSDGRGLAIVEALCSEVRVAELEVGTSIEVIFDGRRDVRRG